MKKKSFNFLLVLLFLSPSGFINAQIPYNYALGGIGINSSNVLIATYTNTSVISYYNNNSSINCFYKVDISGSVQEYDLPRSPSYQVLDMTVVSDFLFFCGIETTATSTQGFIGRLDLNTGSMVIDAAGSNISSSITKLVAYKTQTGLIKVVALGNDVCVGGNPAIIQTNCPSELYRFSLYTYNFSQFILECTMTDPMNPMGTCQTLTVRDDIHDEWLEDIVLTDSYVVFLGNTKQSLSVHKCSRNNVLADFNDLWYYPDTKYYWFSPIGCDMDNDRVAMAAMGDDIGFGYSTLMQVIDLATMNVTNSQTIVYPTAFKTYPEDLIYLKNSQILVLLQPNYYYSGIPDPIFHNFLPSASANYNANCFYENNSGVLWFQKMDRLPDGKNYVSTGGDYWMLKNSSINASPNSCFAPINIPIDIRPVPTKNHINHPFVSCSISLNYSIDNTTNIQPLFSPYCID